MQVAAEEGMLPEMDVAILSIRKVVVGEICAVHGQGATTVDQHNDPLPRAQTSYRLLTH